MAERVDRPLSLFDRDRVGPLDEAGPERDEGLGGGLTLDDAIVDVWEGLAARAIVACPVCGGALRPRGAAGGAGEAAGTADPGDAAGASCRDCGTTLG